uniref:Glucose-6-phosphate isomerase n=1 Tax=Lygus hesperus TaxID=30085 RepID=A0A0A9Z555_LYGHE
MGLLDIDENDDSDIVVVKVKRQPSGSQMYGQTSKLQTPVLQSVATPMVTANTCRNNINIDSSKKNVKGVVLAGNVLNNVSENVFKGKVVTQNKSDVNFDDLFGDGASQTNAYQ